MALVSASRFASSSCLIDRIAASGSTWAGDTTQNACQCGGVAATARRDDALDCHLPAACAGEFPRGVTVTPQSRENFSMIPGRRQRPANATLDARPGCDPAASGTAGAPSGPHSLVVRPGGQAHGTRTVRSVRRLRPTSRARELLFKPDCPRAIDHHIDYFDGAGESPAETDDNGCGE